MEKGFLGTNIVVQIGIVVRDIEKAAQDYADFLGVDKPPIYESGAYEDAGTEYRGGPTRARAKQAFFKIGPNIDIELLAPDEEPSTWREELDASGEGIHHIAFFVKGMAEKIAQFERNGFPLLQKGEYTGGRYAYHDTKAKLKTIVELLENDGK
ncbi:MAG: VOC family protein [Clostridiales bacterium]|jgi:catechol 2,3-dioxygenase-like lactoylglutathione lyase family enzyme|nr:VOC family protein [Clostridiales bacterium]